MSEDADAPKLPLPELHPESLVCRLARNARWINSEDQRRLIPEAFLRRRTESGLSVNIEGACDVDFIEKMRHDTPPLKAHGKADLRVGPIRDLPFPLDVIQTPKRMLISLECQLWVIFLSWHSNDISMRLGVWYHIKGNGKSRMGPTRKSALP